MPLFSIIIAVYNDWTALEGCLHSLQQQADGPDFEVIIVDDGSDESAPEKIRESERGFQLAIRRQPHAGISVARNHGIRVSHGSILLFTDADCRIQPGCLAALARAIADSPQYGYFQLRLIGDCSTFVGRTEHLRLTTLQSQTLEPNGCLRYLNTAGFAVRRSNVETDNGLFDPGVVRGEDTLLLADLIERALLPFFVADAVVQHNVPLSLFACFRKDIRSAFLEGRTYVLIASRGIKIRMSHRQRLTMLRSMWKTSRQPSIGVFAFLALTIRQSLSRISSIVYRLLRGRSDSVVARSRSLEGLL